MITSGNIYILRGMIAQYIDNSDPKGLWGYINKNKEVINEILSQEIMLRRENSWAYTEETEDRWAYWEHQYMTGEIYTIIYAKDGREYIAMYEDLILAEYNSTFKDAMQECNTHYKKHEKDK